MANKKRKVSHIDFLHCYQYFERAIQSGRFLHGSETDIIHNTAKQHFLDLPRQENDEQSIQALQNWIDQFVDNETWGKCYRSLNQKRYLDVHDSRTININEHTHVKLKSYAQKNNINLSDAITNLLDGCILSNKEEPNQKKLHACADYRQVSPEALLENLIDSECRSIEYAKVRAAEELEKTNKENKIYKASNRKISKLFFIHLNHFKLTNHPQDIYSDSTEFIEHLVEDEVISGKVDEDKIVHSEPIKITRSGYFDYASTIANFIASITGTMDVFLTKWIFKTEHSMVFIGMPDNVDVAIRLFKLVMSQARSAKSEYLKTLSKRMKQKNRTSRASEYMNDWTSSFDCLGGEDELYIGNSYDLLNKYKDETWPNK